MRAAKPVIIVHGGAGDWPSELHKRGLNGVRVAADRRFRTLSRGDSALDAVQVAVVAMEGTPCSMPGEAHYSILLATLRLTQPSWMERLSKELASLY